MQSVKIVYLLLVLILSIYSNDALGNCDSIGRQMLMASKSGKYDMLKKTLEEAKKQGCKIYNTHGGYDSYVMAAARNQHYEIIKLLLEYGLDIDTQEKQPKSSILYKTALIEAVEQKDIPLIKFLLENGADPEHKSSANISALEIARTSGDIEIVKLFLENVTDKNDLLFKVLSQRSDKNRAEMVNILLKYGVDPNIKNTHSIYQATPLIAAVVNIEIEKDTQLKIVKLLIDNGADVNARNRHDRTAIFFVAAYSNGNYGVAKLLLDNGAEVFYFDKSWATPLVRNWITGNLTIMFLLIWKIILAITLFLLFFIFFVIRNKSGYEQFIKTIKTLATIFVLSLIIRIILQMLNWLPQLAM